MKFREPCLFLDFPPALPKCPMPPIEPRDFLPIHPWLEPCRGALEEPISLALPPHLAYPYPWE